MHATYFMNSKKGGKSKGKNTKRRGDFVKKEDDPSLQEAIVTEALPNTQFRVKFKLAVKDSDSDYESDEKIAYLAGKMVRFRIRILVGDKVSIKTDPYGGKGRIVKRL